MMMMVMMRIVENEYYDVVDDIRMKDSNKKHSLGLTTIDFQMAAPNTFLSQGSTSKNRYRWIIFNLVLLEMRSKLKMSAEKPSPPWKRSTGNLGRLPLPLNAMILISAPVSLGRNGVTQDFSSSLTFLIRQH